MTHVLIVDDKPENLYLLRALLQGHGCSVDEARHGAEALVKARQTLPQLIISDLLMPVMDGYTLLRHWKADERLQAIPFVVYTATYTEPKDERLALDLGADMFILKPAEPEPFMSCIWEVLEKHERGQLPTARQPLGDEKVQLKEYSEILIRKLEEKAFQLEQTNRALLEDIAQRQQSEAALRQSESRLRAILDTEPECVKLLDIESNLLEMNRAGLAMIEADSVDQVKSCPVLDLVAPEHKHAFQTLNQRVFQGETGTLEFEIIGLKGTRRWLETHAVPLRDSGRAVTALLGITRDITVQKRAEAELRESEARIRSIFEQANDAIFVFSSDHHFIEANSSGIAMLGYTREEFLRLGVADILATHERARLARESAEMMSGRPHLAEWEHLRKDGSTFPAEVSAQKLNDGSYLAIVRDLTTRKRTEDELREGRARLQLLVHASNIGLWDWNLLTNEVYFSPEWKSQLGYADDQLPSRFEEWECRLHPNDRQYLGGSERLSEKSAS